MASKQMKGVTLECLKHFVANHQDADVQLSTGCKVKLLTTRRWIARDGRMMPNGEAMNALRVFLWDRGYEVAELAKIDQLYRELALLVGRGKVFVQDVVAALNLRTADELWRLFRGDRNLSEGRRGIVRQIVDRAREGAIGAAEPEVTLPGHPEGAEPKPETIPDGAAIAREAVLAMAASHVRALGPLIATINSLSCTDGDRAHFRELAGSGVVFEAANTLNQLCSTKARKLAKSGSGKEVARA